MTGGHRSFETVTTSVLAILLLVALIIPAAAAPLAQNGGFADRSAADRRLPEGWAVPADSPWQLTDADGYGDNQSLQCHALKAAAIEPVSQAIVLPAGADLVLSCAMKSDGASQPVVRLRREGPEGAEVVRLVAEAPPGIWRPYQARFSSGEGGPMVLELWTDLARLHSPERRAAAGKVLFDDVQVLTPQEAAQQQTGAAAVATENVARGKRYTLQPTPGYPHCTDPGDTTQLTDGQYTAGYFWTQKSTVGWLRNQDLVITLDLGEHVPIRGVSFNSAAGIAGVKWPSAIRIQVSVDGRAYHELGDLLKLSATPPAPDGNYTVQRFHTTGLQAHGRYLKLLISPVGNCTFVDEIEVYRGDEAFKQAALPGKAIIYPPEYFDADMFTVNFKRRLGLDLETVRTLLEHEKLPAALRQRTDAAIAELSAAIPEHPAMDAKTFYGVLPFSPLHERIYALLGAARAAMGKAPLVAWAANPWDYLAPTDLPANPPRPLLSTALMQGETRACTLNLTNCHDELLTAHLRFEGLPAALAQGLRLHDVLWTDTPASVPVAAALPELAAQDGRYEVSLPAGMTRQVWFSVTARDVPAGVHRGTLVIEDAAAQPLRVPVSVRVFDLQFPERPRLRTGGWDYTNTTLYSVTQQNRPAFIAHLQSRGVNSPWATSGVLALPEFDATGQFVKPPSTQSLDNWVRDWPEASGYYVFCHVDGVADPKPEDPLFSAKVGNWIRFWVDHLKSLGIGPDRLYLLLVDEPGSEKEDAVIIAWAKAIKAAAPDVNVWDDGTRPLERMTPDILAAVDYMCPHRPSLMADKQPATPAVYRQQKAGGKGLYLYSCWGPTRTLDPYAYYRLQAWDAFRMGAEGSFFWAMGGGGGGSCFNDYVQKNTSYTPVFLTPDSVTAGKHLEAIREGQADFEYLCMLRDRIAELEQRQPQHRLLAQAKALLAKAADRVLKAPGAEIDEYAVTEMRWNAPRDRNQADAVRVEVGEMLEKLK